MRTGSRDLQTGVGAARLTMGVLSQGKLEVSRYARLVSRPHLKAFDDLSFFHRSGNRSDQNFIFEEKWA